MGATLNVLKGINPLTITARNAREPPRQQADTLRAPRDIEPCARASWNGPMEDPCISPGTDADHLHASRGAAIQHVLPENAGEIRSLVTAVQTEGLRATAVGENTRRQL